MCRNICFLYPISNSVFRHIQIICSCFNSNPIFHIIIHHIKSPILQNVIISIAHTFYCFNVFLWYLIAFLHTKSSSTPYNRSRMLFELLPNNIRLIITSPLSSSSPPLAPSLLLPQSLVPTVPAYQFGSPA